LSGGGSGGGSGSLLSRVCQQETCCEWVGDGEEGGEGANFARGWWLSRCRVEKREVVSRKFGRGLQHLWFRWRLPCWCDVGEG